MSVRDSFSSSLSILDLPGFFFSFFFFSHQTQVPEIAYGMYVHTCVEENALWFFFFFNRRIDAHTVYSEAQVLMKRVVFLYRSENVL